MTIVVLLAFLVLLVPEWCEAFLGLASNTVQQRQLPLDPTFVNPDAAGAGITEELCLDTANRMQRVKVPVSESIHPDSKVGISYTYWPASGGAGRSRRLPPVVLVHGFDSSNLEFRRLGSRLASRGLDTYAVDLLGWGYTQLQGVQDFSAKAKVEALQSFLSTVIGPEQPFCVAGASLGGAAAIETAAVNPKCAGLILIDAQGFVDGIGPMSMLPKPIAQLGVGVLKSIPLRSSANQMSYYDKETFATDEAVTVGRLHCLQEGWSDALVNFMQSGGFAPSQLVPQVAAPSLILWGRQDGILDGNEFAPKFVETLQNAEVKWIEESGHVPHLEQPDTTADAILVFVSSLKDKAGTGDASADTVQRTPPQWIAGGLGVAGISALAATLADWLPAF